MRREGTISVLVLSTALVVSARPASAPRLPGPSLHQRPPGLTLAPFAPDLAARDLLAPVRAPSGATEVAFWVAARVIEEHSASR